MKDAAQVCEFVKRLGGRCRSTKVFVANNSLAALKFIVSIKDFAFRRFGRCEFEFYGIERPSDKAGESKYLDVLTDYRTVPEEDTAQSFRNPRVLCQVAAEFGCEYLWPGWGHASEDPALPEECAKCGIVFLGPSAHAMERLGSKISANALADQCGIQTIPWMEVRDKETCEAFSEKIGYPVMVKTPEGGGGKGIRIVERREDLMEQVETVKKETASTRVFITKYLADIKHIELQIVADSEGNVEIPSSRDCTLQRRNQKLVEEGPAQIPENVLEDICAKAKSLVKAAGYVNAGTIEFVYDIGAGAAYFLEANPRLQVEHTVTELLTDTNLCMVQWLISCGVSLPALKEHGVLRPQQPGRHVVGARVIAECADSGFMPSTGDVFVSASFPAGTVGYFAVDRGCIGPYNDSQFGHVFGVGSSREEAVRSLHMVLSSAKIHGGVKTLNRFIFDLTSTREFLAGEHNTRFSEAYQQTWSVARVADPFYVLSFLSMYMHRAGKRSETVVVQHCGAEIRAGVEQVGVGVYCVTVNGGVSVVKIAPLASDRYRVKRSEGTYKTFFISQNGNIYDLFSNGKTKNFKLGPAGNSVVSEVSGRVIRFLADTRAEKNKDYIEIESMKNIMRFAAPKTGTLVKKVAPGDTVCAGQVLAEITTSDLEQQIVYTDKIEYANTSRNYSLGLFEGYAVPEKLFRFDTDTVLQALAAYAALRKPPTPPLMSAYLLRGLQVLAEAQMSLLPHKDLIRAVKLRASSQRDTAVLEKAAALEAACAAQARKEEHAKCAAEIHATGRDYFQHPGTQALSASVALSLCLFPGTQKDACMLWVHKVFGKQGTPEAHGVRFVFGSSMCFVSAEGMASPEDIGQEEGLIFYIKHESTPPLTSPVMVTNISVQPGLSTVWETYQRGKKASLYNGTDPILAERLHLERLDTPCLLGVYYGRRVFVYSTDNGQSMSIQCVVSSWEEGGEDWSFRTLMEEARAGYLLARMPVPFTVSLCVLSPLRVPQTVLVQRVMKTVKQESALVEECGAKEVMLYGSVHIEERPSASQEYVASFEMPSPCAGDSPFVVSVSTMRGFKETVVWISQKQVLYAIEDRVIRRALCRSGKKASDVLKQVSLEEIETSRAKAKALDTIYIYDLVSLIEIFLKENSANVKIEDLHSAHPECAMKAWRISQDGIEFMLVGNDITKHNGAFSILEDKLFSACASIALNEKLPFVYVSSNSGAKIEVMESLKEAIRYDKDLDMVYLHPEEYNSLKNPEALKVAETVLRDQPVFRIDAVFGEYGMGVENLSFSAEIARQMALLYTAVPTLTYVTGRAVGIGAYLARLGGRVVQKRSAPIILTGYQALNRLIQKELYKSNLEIGGPAIMGSNGVVQSVVSTDTQGAEELLRYLEYATDTPSSTHPSFSERPLPNLAQMETLNSEELVEYLSDKDACTEYYAGWAPNVRIARTRIGGASCGVVFPRVGSVSKDSPAFPDEPSVLWTEYLLLPETSRKIAQAIQNFSLEGLNVLIIANWKGFSAGHIDMHSGILQDGSDIVNSLVFASTKIFTYIGPNAELRGGSWVVFDKKISSNVFFAAHPTATGSVIHPDGLSKIKCKPAELQRILEKSGIEPSPVTQFSLGKKFCALHDTAERMMKMQAIDKVIPVKDLKSEILRFFFSDKKN